MAPEMACLEPYSSSVDNWATGIMFGAMLTGRSLWYVERYVVVPPNKS